MNLYKTKYGLVKERLWNYGKNIRKTERTYSANTWDYIIDSYLTHWCDSAEREFIDLIFFKRYTIKSVSTRLYIDESVCSRKKEKIMDCLLGLAMQEQLVFIDPVNGEDAAFCGDYSLGNACWVKIEKIISDKIGRVTLSARLSVEAMVYITRQKTPWRELPKRYGAWKTVHNRYLRWKRCGLWDQICEELEFL